MAVAGHKEDAVVLRTDREPQQGEQFGHIWNSTCPSFGECKTCSIHIMQHWHPDSPEDDFVKVIKHIDTAFKLANTAIPGSQNHHVMSPCAEIEGAPTSCFLFEAQARKQCMLGKWPDCQSMSKADKTLTSPKRQQVEEKRFRKQERGQSAGEQQCPIHSPYNQIIICKLDLKFSFNCKCNKIKYTGCLCLKDSPKARRVSPGIVWVT